MAWLFLWSVAPRAAAQPAPATPQVSTGWQDGFVIRSPDDANRLVLGATIQMDGRFSLDDPPPFTGSFLIRKARPTLSGRIARYFEFRLMPDFGNGLSTVADAYVDMRFSPAFRLRTGKDKTPVGYELLVGDPYLLFPERALASGLVPVRDIGVQALGEFAGGRASYAAGIFNGIPDGSTSTADVDSNDGKDLAGRLVLSPFGTSASPSPLRGFGVHIGASTGREAGALPSFKTSAGQTFFSYAADVRADGRRNRVTPAVFYYHGSIGAFAEYVRSAQTVSTGDTRVDVANHGWDVTGSFVLTGEPASERGVRPRRNFDPPNDMWGALQVVARYSRLSLDPRVFARQLAGPTASAAAASFTVGINWYPTPFIKYYVTVERTTFGATESGRRPAERVVLFRTQLAF